MVSTILEDDYGVLWMGGNQGIHGAARAELLAVLAGTQRQVRARRISRSSGADNPEGSGRQGVRDRDGRLWFPTFGGAVAVLPDAQQAIEARLGAVTVDAIVAGGTPLPVSDTVRVPGGVRDVVVEVASVSLRDPAAGLLEYRLAGHVASWEPLPEAHRLPLPRLRSGRWLLEVRQAGTVGLATGAGGAPRAVGAAVRQPADAALARVVLVIPPRWHETWWFRVLLALGGVASVAGIVRLRGRALEARAAALDAEVAEQTRWLQVEHERTAEALERAAATGAQLRSLLDSKARVFAGLSHELRTPLSLVVGPVRALERAATAPGFPAESRGHLGTLRAAVQRLERLTGQFLDLADVQAGSLRLRPRRADVGAFVRECVALMAPLAAQKPVRLVLSLEEGPSPLEARIDPDHLDKVVTNLVANAIRHAPVDGEVRVALRRADGAEAGGPQALELTVRDNGPGIAPEYLERVFDPFFQAPGATEGMGLGLAISRDVVVLHGGRIEAESPPGSGAMFRVRLPALAPTNGARSTPTARSAAAAVPAPAPVGTRPRLLFVEDDGALRQFVAEQLSARYEVLEAESGEAAMALVRRVIPDAVVSDVVMPGMDGVGLCRILKADPVTRNVPVVLLTAKGSREDRLAGLAAGADEYLVKPVDTDLLTLKLENLRRLRRAIEERFAQALPAWSAVLMRSGVDRLEPASEQFLERLYRMLVERMGDPELDVDRMAHALFVSRSSLYRRVREVLGCSPLDVLTEVRLEQAALALRTSEEPVGTIATRVGFRSAAHFARRFTAHFGVPPTEYRLQQRG